MIDASYVLYINCTFFPIPFCVVIHWFFAYIMVQQIYCVLAKEWPWAKHLTSPSKRRVAALLSVSALSTKECPCHVWRFNALEAND